MNLSQALLRALADRGAREVFGIPGDFVLGLFRQIETAGILPLITLSHEPAIAFAADAAARYRAGLGVVAATYGAGALNLVNAVASAYAEKVPLVVLSGAPGRHERRSGLMLHHQVKHLDSQAAIFREITCDQVVLDDPDTAPALIARALQRCRSASRPVYIEIPRDMVDQACGAVPPDAPATPDHAAIAACVDEVLTRLASASAPLLMVGVEIRRYGIEAKVARLARLLGVPVVSTFMGQGLLAETDAPLLGTYLGRAGDPAVTAAVEGSDALLMLGVILSDTNFGAQQQEINLHKCMVATDGQVAMGYHVYPQIALEALVDGLLAQATPIGEATAHQPAAPLSGLVQDDSPVSPSDIARAINDLMARHGRMPIASDVGDCLFTALDIANTALVAPGYYATMGYGVPAGIGIQASSGERPLVLVGDGAFQMTGWELGNCQRYGYDPIVIVFNNCSWGMLRAFEPQAGFNRLSDWHFADAARALGGDGERVHTRRALGDALERAWQRRGRFQLIEVMIADGAVSATLDRFVAGVRRLHAPACA
ncbi:indolepyruvate/phenylpyruvate decarboxylase [Massilia sp. TS11]|uniref:indolepyruvate/phenylpyruvate decarboxylase n=1 Tax=Massilia sp. TS11 TaxID=2908003 RepID=UPI001EDC4102|nr:indolepyruvate/phenylpyruvate decarboxylase [Massilia sp. TS11]MCG2585928.1 indolepyruvate/phenylpyruvate decarboxylase [Massilia sp. TS11]